MTAPQFDRQNAMIADTLLERGAIGARLISAKQVGNAAFELQLQTTDDRRITVRFVANAQIQLTGQMEIKAVAGPGEQEPPVG